MATLREYFLSHLCVQWVIILCVANQVFMLLLSSGFVSRYYYYSSSLPTTTTTTTTTLQDGHWKRQEHAVTTTSPGRGTISLQADLPIAKQQHDVKAAKQQLRNTTNSWYSKEGDPSQDRCAICFFGLPRSFETMVLPSIVKNVLIPNARHNCDVFMHFYEIYEETAGRKNQGGRLDPRQVYLLEQAVQNVHAEHHGHDGLSLPGTTSRRHPIVSFINDTDAVFWKKRGAVIAKYQNTTNPKTGRPLYFPWSSKTYQKSSVDNIVRQWHSIESVFRLMETTGQQLHVNYSRVGMFRSDVMYMTPIDIAMMDKGVIDSENRHVVVPGFGSWPVNDRMIYGNFEGVKVWSTRRFSLIEERASSQKNAGYVMHSERFLNASVFPSIEASGYNVNTNWDICFIRTRADMTALISDCAISGNSRGWDKVDGRALVESIIQKNCSSPFITDTRPKRKWEFTYVGCEDGILYPKDRPRDYKMSKPGREGKTIRRVSGKHQRYS